MNGKVSLDPASVRARLELFRALKRQLILDRHELDRMLASRSLSKEEERRIRSLLVELEGEGFLWK